MSPLLAVRDHEAGRWVAHRTVEKFSAGLIREVFGDLRLREDHGLVAGRHELIRPDGADLRQITRADLARFGVEPDLPTVEVPGNILCTAGVTRMLNLLIGAGGQALNSTHMRVGVGDTTPGSVAASDTDMAAATGATHRWWQLPDSTYPSVSNNVLTAVITVGTSDANFHWLEWGIDAGTASGTGAATAPLLNHKAADQGTKASGQIWVPTNTITIS